MTIYRICKRCVMDTSDPDINFDKNGCCNKCSSVLKTLSSYPFNLSVYEKEKRLNKLIYEIREAGLTKTYNCIIGVSGGADSTFLAYKVKKAGLKPLAVHLDNGWNSELAQKNIETTLQKLDIDLYTYVIDWEEFKDIQLSFLKASTPDCEIPTDHAIIAVLYQIAAKHNLKYILTGVNMSTESVQVTSWSNGIYDWKYIKSIQGKFGNAKFRTFPHFSLQKLFYYRYILNIKRIAFLDYLEYNKASAVKNLCEEIGWRDYEQKHYESFYTKFFQAYILPVKFGFDKRKPHLSSLILSNQLTRKKALEELKKPLYEPSKLNEDKEYVAKKFGLKVKELDNLISNPPKKFEDYPSYQKESYYQFLLMLNEKYKQFHKIKYSFS